MCFPIINKINKLKRIVFLTLITLFIFSSTLFALCLDPITGELTDDCDDPAAEPIDLPIDNNTYILVALSTCLALGTINKQKVSICNQIK
jgi:hypothetical protein